MTVGVVHQDGAVGDDGVQGLLGGAPAGEPGLMPATTENPWPIRVVCRVPFHIGDGVLGTRAAFE